MSGSERAGGDDAPTSSGHGAWVGVFTGALLGRRDECEVLDGMVDDARDGRSAVVVIRADAGLGKTALLEHVLDRVEGWHVVTARGVELEMELTYSGLHQILGSMLERLDGLPVPQRRALETVFGMAANRPPDRLLVGLATLSLLAAAAEDRPVACIVDDAQWLDSASAETLAVVARRLLAERVLLVCAARPTRGHDPLADLPELVLRGMSPAAARTLLVSLVHGPLDPVVADQIVRESRGNPLALREFLRARGGPELAGGFAIASGVAAGGRSSIASTLERGYAARARRLAPDARTLVVAAAAEPLGDPALLRRASAELGIDPSAIGPAIDDDLLRIDERVEFGHPLVRSAVYADAPVDKRREVHRALAAATDASVDPERRAWHLAQASTRPDEDVARELERCAGRARGRGGLSAAAAFLGRAARLTPDPAQRVRRSLDAIATQLDAGALAAARSLLAAVHAHPLTEEQLARADLLQARLALVSSRGNAATALLLSAGERLEHLDARLSRETYLDAFAAAHFGAHLGERAGVLATTRAAADAPRPPGEPSAADLLLDAYVALEGPFDAAVPVCQAALRALRGDGVTETQLLRWAWHGIVIALELWDDEAAHALSTTYLRLARETGALGELARALTSCPQIFVDCGEFDAAAGCVAELESVQAVTGIETASYAALKLHAFMGDERSTRQLIDVTMRAAREREEGTAIHSAEHARAVLCNGLSRYREAAEAAGLIAAHRALVHESWTLPELVEGASRAGLADVARRGAEQLAEKASVARTPWALALSARCRALLADTDADALFREALDHLARTRVRTDVARTHLLYGEWLRRAGRRLDARRELTLAHEQCTAIGMHGFAERARRELVATGAAVRHRRHAAHDDLTAQELQIARLARDGLANADIGARLYLSPRTVEWHLRNVYAKLGVSGRAELAGSLPQGAP